MMTSQTILMTSLVTSFDRKFERVFDQMKHCKTFSFIRFKLERIMLRIQSTEGQKLCCQ